MKPLPKSQGCNLQATQLFRARELILAYTVHGVFNDSIACNVLGAAIYNFPVKPEYQFYIVLVAALIQA
jgi:hypothetical protein